MKTKHNSNKTALSPRYFIIIGIVILVAVVFLIKNQPSENAIPENETPEEQFDRYLEDGKAIFVFFHSVDCHLCIVMMETVDNVYPEFKDTVAMVDVNVYDPQNQALLQRARINSIPTLIFISRNGEGKISVGVLEEDLLREQLTALKELP